MAGLSSDSALERADDYSCDSDSGDTVVLKDDETYDRCEDGLSFVRFMSLEGGATTDGELITTAAAMNTSTSKLAPLPTGLSFLYNHPHFLNPSISPGSFMFTECRLQMAMDEQKPRQAVDSTPNFSTPISSASDTATFLAPNLVEIAPKPASPSPGYNQTQPSAPQPPLSENVSDSNHRFKHPKVIQLSDLRCKNREAARKCRAKKKNYIQQLEHDFKDLKDSAKITSIRDEFGLVPAMYAGLAGNRGLVEPASATPPHPAAEAEARFGAAAQHSQSMRILRATQGLQAPLRLAMEERVMQRMTPRLPGLCAHHPLAAQLSGALDTIDFCDILNNPEDAEVMGSMHMLVERQQGIL